MMVYPNPLVRIILGLTGLLAVSSAPGMLPLGYVFAAYIILCWSLRLQLSQAVNDIRLMLPFTTLFFVIHVSFATVAEAEIPVLGVLKRELIVWFRLIGLTAVIGPVRAGLTAQSLVDSLKTALDRLHIRSHLAEDLLQTLRLIMVFIPQVKQEYHLLERFNRALGFAPANRLRDKVRFYSGNLMPVLARSLGRAGLLGEVMMMRGYGRVIPRGQLTPIPFRTRDAFQVVLVMAVLGGTVWLF